ncbi:hypothetical protein QYE76_054811 [Lolium multiflorum]|uniref:Peptidase A1 domain-containing protein n=1 Tax=Lolium multiflorum TaxID=4521 RepID=A0AAD8WL79_LOLMU|nr:hypothetical protein QYE76_054811 [Lolium multiflorum]
MAGQALLLVAFVLTAQLCGCTAYVGGGFSVEFIHRDSPKSPLYDPKLTVHGRVLAAAQRSTAQAAALARSYTTIVSPSPEGAVSEIISRPFEYLMYVNIGTPGTRTLAVADTGSNLVWFRCVNGSSADPPPPASGSDAHPEDVVFDVSSSATYGRVGCNSGACHALPATSCDASSNCNYLQTYGDGSNTTGILSTETFFFEDAPGGCVGCRDRPQLVVHEVNFGCSTSINGPFPWNGVVGLADGNMSLVSQIGAVTSLGRRFSYCLAPYNVNASSALNFGSRADVTEVDAVSTVLVPSPFESLYTVALESVEISNSTFTVPPDQSHLVVDSGTSITYLHEGLLDQVVEEVNRTIKLPQVSSTERILPLCYDATGMTEESILEKMIPDVKLVMGGGAVVTLKARNTFVQVDQVTVCMAVLPVGDLPFAILGNVAQQNMHVGYDLDKRTITFATADCTTTYPSPPASL